jgi:phage terminase large subunit
VEFKTTSVYERNAASWLARNQGKRRALNEGGTSSSKTYSILQALILIAKYARSNTLISVVSETMPHLKRGCIRDFINLMGDEFDARKWNKSDFIYRFPKAEIEFFSADQPAKLRGGRRKILYINECNNVAWDAFQELDVRTEWFTFLDWNPVSEFWAHEKGLINDPENVYIHSTYQDARHVLPESVVTNIESRKDKDPNWWNVYGLGLIGKIEGLVYPYFDQVEELPAYGAKVYGLDFGFSGDPAVLTEHRITPTDIFSREHFYEKNLTNHDICVKMAECGVRKHSDEIYADSAEPKSIEEIYQEGYNIKPAPKGEGSVEYGHQKIRQYKQHWTKDSLNCIKEQRNFRYITDKNGKLTEKTTHQWSHGMDSRRYAAVGHLDNIPGSVDAEAANTKSNAAFTGIRKKEF